MKIGIVINPIAGMGGSVGLKGTDGLEILKEAIKRGAIKKSEEKSSDSFLPLKDKSIKIFSSTGNMGGNILSKLNIDYQDVYNPESTTDEIDTKNVLEKFLKINVDLIVFAGGDGTARNVCEIIQQRIPVIGIPTGVKIHSPVFCISPKAAGELIKKFILSRIKSYNEAEVIDLDEEDYRNEKINTKLFGYMKVPVDTSLMQCKKSGTVLNDKHNQFAIAEHIIEEMKKDQIYLIGAGTTTKAITDRLDIEGTLLGIDAVKNCKIIGKDLTEKEILKVANGEIVNLIITPIGGQGFIFGRGNQQLSPKVLKQIVKKNITIVCGKTKLNNLMGRNLLIETGDEILSKHLTGYYKVITGYHEFTFYKAAIDL